MGSLKRRSTWLVAMLASLAFIAMAVKVYKVSASTLVNQLVAALIILFVIVVFSAILGWLIAKWRKRGSR